MLWILNRVIRKVLEEEQRTEGEEGLVDWISGSVSRQKQQQIPSPVVGGTQDGQSGWSAVNKRMSRRSPSWRGDGGPMVYGFVGVCRALAFTLGWESTEGF